MLSSATMDWICSVVTIQRCQHLLIKQIYSMKKGICAANQIQTQGFALFKWRCVLLSFFSQPSLQCVPPPPPPLHTHTHKPPHSFVQHSKECRVYGNKIIVVMSSGPWFTQPVWYLKLWCNSAQCSKSHYPVCFLCILLCLK